MATIEVQEIPVAIDTLVLRGDTILVFNGVVIGSLGKRQVPCEPMTVALPNSGGGYTNIPTIKVSSEPTKKSCKAFNLTREVITDALFKMGAATTMELGDFLNIPRSEGNARGRIGRVMKNLAKIKVIEPVKNDGRVKMHAYTLTKLNGNPTNVVA